VLFVGAKEWRKEDEKTKEIFNERLKRGSGERALHFLEWLKGGGRVNTLYSPQRKKKKKDGFGAGSTLERNYGGRRWFRKAKGLRG